MTFDQFTPRGLKRFWRQWYYSVFNKSHVTPHIMQDSHVSNTDNSDVIRLSQFFNDNNAPFTNVVFDEGKVIRAINKIRNASAPGPDNITPFFLKQVENVVAGFLANLMNMSMRTGEIPDSFKNAVVLPIDKGGNKLEPKTYSIGLYHLLVS